MADEWYVGISDPPVGPVTKATLGKMFSWGQINRQTLVIREGIPNWIPIENVPELRDILPAATPKPNYTPPPPKPASTSPTPSHSVSRKTKESPFVEFLMKIGFEDADCPGNVIEIPGSIALGVLVSGLITFWAYALIPKLTLFVFIVVLVIAFTAFYCTNKVLIIILSSLAAISIIVFIVALASTSDSKTASAAVMAMCSVSKGEISCC